MPSRKHGQCQVLVVLIILFVLRTEIDSECKADDHQSTLQVTTFQCEVSPTLGEPIGLGVYAIAQTKEHPLLAKGILLKDSGGVYVLCGLDWMDLRNESYDFLREQIARAAETEASRVALHCLHQHTAPSFNASAQKLQLDEDDPRRLATQAYERDTAKTIASAIHNAKMQWKNVTQLGTSKAKVNRVASNRRIELEDGSIVTRWSSTTDSKLQDAPEGLIDPWLRTLSFYHGQKPLARIHYYATHPQSFYGDARLSYDTVGIARERLQMESGVFQIYFTGCSGNIVMGKYNDRSRAARSALADRIHEAMVRSVSDVKLEAVTPIRWNTVNVQFPLRHDQEFSEKTNRELMADTNEPFNVRRNAAGLISWIERVKNQHPVELSCMTIGSVKLLHLPGEPFVQYQLTAQRLQPESFVLVAGYGDCGMGYIGVDRIYTDNGGYEQTQAFTGPCEHMLLKAIDELLADKSESR